jgi:uncharacterized protein YicC (UPF0701 family)
MNRADCIATIETWKAAIAKADAAVDAEMQQALHLRHELDRAIAHHQREIQRLQDNFNSSIDAIHRRVNDIRARAEKAPGVVKTYETYLENIEAISRLLEAAKEIA